MNDIEIIWQTGRMILHLEGFFPCTMGMFEKLLKLIALDFANQANILNALDLFFKRKLVELDVEITNNSLTYLSLVQELGEVKRKIKTGKEPSGVYINESNIKVLKTDMKKIKKKIDVCVKSTKVCKTNMKRFKKYIETKQRKG